MKISKPAFPEALEENPSLPDKIQDFEENETDIKYSMFRTQTLIGCKTSSLGWKGCKISGCKINECAFYKASFSDILFENCDLSNCDFSEASFVRVSFIGCKLVGCTFREAYLRHVTLTGCRGDFSDFTSSAIRDCLWEDCALPGSSFAECKLSTQFIKCTLVDTNFFHTSLQGLDFTTCDLNRIVVSPEDLRGATVTTEQAAGLAKLFGLIVVP